MTRADAKTDYWLEARRIGRRHADGWLLRNMSLTIEPGQRVAIVGPTGSGKTLLMRALALLDSIDEGELLWKGRPVASAEVPEFRRQVMYLQQRANLFPGTVEENLRLPLTLTTHRKRRYDRQRILHWLQLIGRGASFLEKSERDLSGGERQLAALLRAMQLDPLIMLLDEPTAALDPEATRAVEQLVHRWQSEANRSFVWISHDADQVQRIAGQVWRLSSAGLLPQE